MTRNVQPRLDSLDLLRGVAALLVVASHLRAFVFENFQSVIASGGLPRIPLRVFYFITGLGHQSVIIFFALSGFLVGGKAFGDIVRNKFSWSHYLLRRITRLWLVIVPALALTWIFDKIGMSMTAGVGYDGRYFDIYSSGPPMTGGVDHSFSTLIGNLAFLQTIAVPTFGSNGPMWSLANEFWYYIVFPLAAWLLCQQGLRFSRATGSLLLLVLIALLPGPLLAGGSIWVAGAAAAWFSRRPTSARLLQSVTARIGALGMLMAALFLSKVPTLELGDIGLGLCIAVALPAIAHLPMVGGWYTSISRALSEVSYTLYLTHFPFLTLVVLAGFAPTRWLPNAWSVSLYSGLLLAAILWAGLIWWLFERNTNFVYSMLSKRLPQRQTTALA